MTTTRKTSKQLRVAIWMGSLALTLGLAICTSGCGGVAMAAYEREVNKKSHRKNKKKKQQRQALLAAGGGSVASVNTSLETRLRWDPPTQNTDGTPCTDLAGYKLYRGPRSRYYDTVVDIPNPLMTEHTLRGLAPGTHYFAVSAYNTTGAESGYSNEATKLIQ